MQTTGDHVEGKRKKQAHLPFMYASRDLRNISTNMQNSQSFNVRVFTPTWHLHIWSTIKRAIYSIPPQQNCVLAVGRIETAHKTNAKEGRNAHTAVVADHELGTILYRHHDKGAPASVGLRKQLS